MADSRAYSTAGGGVLYFHYFAEALACQAVCLLWAGRLDEATVVGAEAEALA